MVFLELPRVVLRIIHRSSERWGEEVKELLKLIEDGESETVEFKESFDKECLETVGAFANTKGGTILVGVSDKGKVKGISIGGESLPKWANEISQHTEPRVVPEVAEVEMRGKRIVVIRVGESPLKPVAVGGRCYRRVGSSNRVMTSAEIAETHLSAVGKSWDSLPAEELGAEGIDPEKVRKFVGRANATGRRKIEEREDPLRVLERLELVKGGKPTWASLLLFGRRLPLSLSQAAVHCGRFRKDRTTIIDDLMIETDIIGQVDEAMKFITRHIGVRYEFEGKPARKEIWEYPLEALREAVINAIVHRDYLMPANIQVEIYDDRMEIWSPGRLPPGITVEELYREGHRSVIRNRSIAGVFYDLGYIERYGTGTTKMVRLCREQGLPEPEFVEVSGGFCVIFRKDIYTEEYLRGLGLNERQVRAVMYVKERGRITNREYQKLADVSKPTASRELAVLVKAGVLKKIGVTGRGTFYGLMGSEREQRAHNGLKKISPDHRGG